MRPYKLFTIICASLMIMGVTVTQGNATTWYLDTSNENLGITGNFASVDITVSGNTATFMIDANQALLGGGGNNFGIARFLFNTNLSTITAGDFSVVNGWSVNANGGTGGFGSFDLNYTDTGSTNRLDPLIFSITDSSITSEYNFFDPNSNGFHFAAHITDFTSHNGYSSAWFADSGSTSAPVPEPGTMVLLGSGLLGLGLFGKKRMKG